MWNSLYWFALSYALKASCVLMFLEEYVEIFQRILKLAVFPVNVDTR